MFHDFKKYKGLYDSLKGPFVRVCKFSNFNEENTEEFWQNFIGIHQPGTVASATKLWLRI
jgi:hypothetical protein